MLFLLERNVYVCVSGFPSVCLVFSASLALSLYPSINLSIHLPTYLSMYPSLPALPQFWKDLSCLEVRKTAWIGSRAVYHGQFRTVCSFCIKENRQNGFYLARVAFFFIANGPSIVPMPVAQVRLRERLAKYFVASKNLRPAQSQEEVGRRLWLLGFATPGPISWDAK